MEYKITNDIIPGLPWTLEQSTKNINHKTEIFYFSLTTCAHCRKGLNWLRNHGVKFKWLYLDKLDPEEKKKIKNWIQDHYKLRTRMGSPFVIFRTQNQDFISNGFDPEYWKTKIR
ncbi:MAG: glutaredoxin [Candidatus Lokiarchaeota archaeon]|nr:glutaredoxin [Candidatus Harpocratesius repetitus]